MKPLPPVIRIYLLIKWPEQNLGKKMNHPDFELCLFNTDPIFIAKAVRAGIQTIIVDWENQEKKQRQEGFNTQINHDTLNDLKEVRAATTGTVICRINAVGPHTPEELDNAIEYGADEVLIPMVRSLKEVRSVIDYVKGKMKIGILIETNDAVARVGELVSLPLQRIYVGLNDLSIENNCRNIFIPISNGTLDEIKRSVFLPFGFGGLTLPNKGYPIPARLLIAEILRLDCSFSFLRRSFLADIKGGNLCFEISRLKEAIQLAKERSYLQKEEDHRELVETIRAIA